MRAAAGFGRPRKSVSAPKIFARIFTLFLCQTSKHDDIATFEAQSVHRNLDYNQMRRGGSR